VIFFDFHRIHRISVIEEYLRKLLLEERRKTSTLFVLTSRVNRSATIKQLEAKGILRFFTEVITTPGTDAIRHKTQGLQNALRRHHIAAAKTIIVGDSEIEFGVSKNLGIKCISVAYGLRGKSYFHTLGQKFVVDSVRELLEALTKVQMSMV